MNTIEEVKKIKWIVKQIGEDIEENGFSTRFASLYLESDEDTEIWKDYCRDIIKEGGYCSLILFTAVIKCNDFQFWLVIEEENILVTLTDYKENLPYEFDIEDHSSIRGFLGCISECLGWQFPSEEQDKYEKAYNTLFKDLESRKTN